MFEVLWRREYSFLYSIAAIRGLALLLKEELGRDIVVRAEWQNGWLASMAQEGAKDALETSLKNKILDDDYILPAIAKIHKVGKEFAAISHALKVTDKSSEEELIAIAEAFYEKLTEYCVELWRSFFLVDILSTMFEEEVVASVSKRNVAPVIEAYSVPSDKSSLFKIGEYFEKEEDLKKRALFVKKNYPDIGSVDPFFHPYSDDQIVEFCQSFTPPKKKKKTTVTIENDHLITLYQEILFVKDKRDDYRREAFYYIHPLLKELAKELEVSFEDLGFLLPHEMFENYVEKIEARKKGVIIDIVDGRTTIRAGELSGEFESTKHPEDVLEIKGTTGCTGKKRGTVQVIRKKEDIAAFKKGNILVAITTNPQHIVAMQKAAAFVTDEGGIACHAAIVAREMGIPCIVGTGNATALLKDGDEVIVDADKGTVTKV